MKFINHGESYEPAAIVLRTALNEFEYPEMSSPFSGNPVTTDVMTSLPGRNGHG